MPFCPNCGAKVEEGAKFCGSCGKPLSSNVDCPAPQKPSKVIIAFPAVGGIFGAGTGSVSYDGQTIKAEKGGTLELEVEKKTDLEIKIKGYFGKAKIGVEPGDKIQVKLTAQGWVQAAKVDMITGADATGGW